MRKLVVGLLVLAVALVGGIGNYTSTTEADPAVGELVGSVTFSVDCGLGVGIAFDGANLWYSCHSGSPNLHRADPTTGVVTASYTVASGLGALSYDATRNVIWAGAESDAVYRIDLDASKNVIGSALAFHTGDMCGLDDGLAFDARNVADPTDDVIYYSDDCWTTTIDVYDLSGSPVESFVWAGPLPGPPNHNSGLAVGGQLLYETSVFESKTYVVDKTTNALQYSYSIAVAGDPNFHPEDMECDTSTFAGLGKHVMWSKEAYSPARAHAFEIEFGSCGIGGKPVPPPFVGGAVDINVDSSAALAGSADGGSGSPVPYTVVLAGAAAAAALAIAAGAVYARRRWLR